MKKERRDAAPAGYQTTHLFTLLDPQLRGPAQHSLDPLQSNSLRLGCKGATECKSRFHQPGSGGKRGLCPGVNLTGKLDAFILLSTLKLRRRTPPTRFLRVVTMIKGALYITAPGTDQTLVIRPFPARTGARMAERIHVAGHATHATQKSLRELLNAACSRLLE